MNELEIVSENYQLYLGDCLEKMKAIEDNSIDLILCDLPYNVTDCPWDSMIPFDSLWPHYKRIIKEKSSILLFGSEPFSSHLRLSNFDMYRYDWYWIKNRPTLFLHAKLRPLKMLENICVFSKSSCYTHNKTYSDNNMNYYPQGVTSSGRKIVKRNFFSGYGARNNKCRRVFESFTGFPRDLLFYSKDNSHVHPTQKPVDLLEYLIKTYTKENELVLDNTMGSGSTGVAAIRAGRKFIGIEKDENYFNIAKERIVRTTSQSDAITLC